MGYGGMPGVQGGIVNRGGVAPGICSDMSCLRQHLTRIVTTPKEHRNQPNDILFPVKLVLIWCEDQRIEFISRQTVYVVPRKVQQHVWANPTGMNIVLLWCKWDYQNMTLCILKNTWLRNVQKYEPKRFSYCDVERPRLDLLPNFNHEGASFIFLSHQTDSTRCVEDYSYNIEPRLELIGIHAVHMSFSECNVFHLWTTLNVTQDHFYVSRCRNRKKSSNTYRRKLTRNVVQQGDVYDPDIMTSLPIPNVFNGGQSYYYLRQCGRSSGTHAPVLCVTTGVAEITV